MIYEYESNYPSLSPPFLSLNVGNIDDNQLLVPAFQHEYVLEKKPRETTPGF
jgi:hypothetical protein